RPAHGPLRVRGHLRTGSSAGEHRRISHRRAGPCAGAGVTVVRSPGGNFVSGYRWEAGGGPVDSRPTRLDPAWRAVESNQFGLGEFMRWAAQANVEPMLAINLGTRGLQEALDLLEYGNTTGA